MKKFRFCSTIKLESNYLKLFDELKGSVTTCTQFQVVLTHGTLCLFLICLFLFFFVLQNLSMKLLVYTNSLHAKPDF